MTINVTISPPFGDLDKDTARRIIKRANRNRETALPSGTAAQLRASLESLLAEESARRWQDEVQQTGQIVARKDGLIDKFRDADETPRQAARDLLSA